MTEAATQDIIIAPGMRQDIDPRMLPMAPAAVPRLLENVRVRRAARFEKRPGQEALATTGLPTSGSGCWIAEHGGRCVVGVETTLPVLRTRDIYARDADDVWNYQGRHGVCTPIRRFTIAGSVARTTAAGQGWPTCVAIGSTLYVAYADGDTSAVTLAAISLDGKVLRSKVVANASNPHLVYANSVLYLVHRLTTGGGTSIRIVPVTPSTLATGGVTTLGTTLTASTINFDVANLEDHTDWLLVHPETSTKIRVNRMTGTSVTNTAQITTASSSTKVGIAGQSGGKIVVVYEDGNNAEVDVFDTALAASTNVVVRTVAGNETWQRQFSVVRTGGNNYAVALGGGDMTAAPAFLSAMMYHARISGSAVVTSGPYKVMHYAPTSKAFIFGAPSSSAQVMAWASDIEANVEPGWALQASNALLALENMGAVGGGAQIEAISYEHIADRHSRNFDQAVPVAALGDGKFATLVGWQDANYHGIDCIIFGLALASESKSLSWRPTTDVQGALCVGGGCLYEITDPESSVTHTHYSTENGFAHAPAIAAEIAAGGSLTSGKDYTYRATYMRVDAQGHVHRSAPSNEEVVSASGGNLTASLNIATLGVSGRHGAEGSATIAEVYRSRDGGPFNYVGSTANVTPTALSVAFTDGLADATVEANRPLYTDSGTIENEPPSGARLMCQGGGRVFVGTWRAHVAQFSKLLIAGAPVEFCDDDAFRIFLPEDFTGMWWFEGVFVGFTKSNIYLVTGDGPTDQGVGTYSEPRRLPTGIGCDDARSIVETKEGLMFQSSGTIYLLPRGFGPPTPIGDAVQEELEDNPFILSAMVCANDTDECAHFVLAHDDTLGSERAVVYNLRIPGWTLDVWGPDTPESESLIGGPAGAAASVDGKFTYVRATWSALSHLPVRQFSVDQHQDYGATGSALWITMTIGFGDWRPFGPLGVGQLQQIAVLGQSRGVTGTEPKISIVVTVDGTAQAAREFAMAGAADAEQYRGVVPTRVRGTSFRVDITDVYNGAYEASAVINALAIEATKEPGLRPPSSGERK